MEEVEVEPGSPTDALHSKHRAPVWIVEDNDRYRTSIAELIDGSGDFACDASFASCEEALERLNNEFAPEIVLMDIGLPGIDGIEGIRRFKALSPTTEIVVLTVYDDDDKVFRALCSGASGYLLKDAPAEAVIVALRDVMKGGSPITPQIARRVLDMFGRLAVPQANYGLTKREKEVLQHIIAGMTKSQMAEKLFLSYYTIDTHLKNIYSKLQVHTRSGAVAKALKERLL